MKFIKNPYFYSKR